MQLRPVLLITHSFPPDNAVGGRRVARFCKYLPSFGIQPIVLTVDPRYSESVDESFLQPAAIHVERTSVWPTPLELYARWKPQGDSAPAVTGNSTKPQRNRTSALATVKQHFLAAVQMPDRHWGWYAPAINAASRLIREHSIQAIFSTAPPWTDHLIARRLKRKFQLPWIADFRDAWSFDPWRHKIGRLPEWTKRLDRRWESACVDAADLVTSVSRETTEDFRLHYPAQPPTKFLTIPNGYDDLSDELALSGADAKQSRLMVYLGELYGERRIDTFCAALTNLVRAGKVAADGFRLLFVGPVSAGILADAKRAAPELFEEDRIEFRPPVCWHDAMAIMNGADLLLIFQGSHRTAIPAKFYDYLPSGKPIFALVERGALSRVIEETKSGVWADPSDEPGIGEVLTHALSLPRRSPQEVERTAGQYHARNLTAKLADHFSIISRPTGCGGVREAS